MILPRLANATRMSATADVALCRELGIKLLPRDQLMPLASSIPVLMLSGEFDPITPPSYAAEMLPLFSRGQHITFPRGSHGQAVTNDCANRIIGNFLDAPEKRVAASCASKAAHDFATNDDIVFIPRLRSVLQTEGIGGLPALVLVELPALGGLLVLLSALILYPLAALARLVLRRRPEWRMRADAWIGHLAPWSAIVTATIVAVYLGGLGAAIGTTLSANQNLFAMGAIPSGWRWLLALPIVVIAAGAAMVVIAIYLWRRHLRSLPGRLYFSFLAFTALATGVALWLAR